MRNVGNFEYILSKFVIKFAGNLSIISRYLENRSYFTVNF